MDGMTQTFQAHFCWVPRQMRGYPVVLAERPATGFAIFLTICRDCQL
jgi:hypothetical protein